MWTSARRAMSIPTPTRASGRGCVRFSASTWRAGGWGTCAGRTGTGASLRSSGGTRPGTAGTKPMPKSSSSGQYTQVMLMYHSYGIYLLPIFFHRQFFFTQYSCRSVNRQLGRGGAALNVVQATRVLLVINCFGV